MLSYSACMPFLLRDELRFSGVLETNIGMYLSRPESCVQSLCKIGKNEKSDIGILNNARFCFYLDLFASLLLKTTYSWNSPIFAVFFNLKWRDAKWHKKISNNFRRMFLKQRQEDVSWCGWYCKFGANICRGFGAVEKITDKVIFTPHPTLRRLTMASTAPKNDNWYKMRTHSYLVASFI